MSAELLLSYELREALAAPIASHPASATRHEEA